MPLGTLAGICEFLPIFYVAQQNYFLLGNIHDTPLTTAKNTYPPAWSPHQAADHRVPLLVIDEHQSKAHETASSGLIAPSGETPDGKNQG
jgi:hypothetical protein